MRNWTKFETLQSLLKFYRTREITGVFSSDKKHLRSQSPFALGLVTLLSRRYNWDIKKITFNNRAMYYSKYEIIPVLFAIDFFKINCAVPSTGRNFLSRLAGFYSFFNDSAAGLCYVCAQSCLFVFLLVIVKVLSGSCIINTRTVSK